MNRRFWVVVGSMAGGLLVFAWLGWQFLLHPVAVDTASQEALLVSKQSDLDQVKGAQAQYEKFKRDAESTRHEVQLLRQRLDPDLSASDLVNIVGGQTGALNPNTLSWDYSPRVPSKLDGQTGLDEIPFKMKFKGDYETVGKLLNGMASQLRFICPERVNLVLFDDKEEGRITMDATLEFRLFLESRGPSSAPKAGN